MQRASHTNGVTLAILRRLAEARGRIVTVEALVFAAYGADPDGGPDDPGAIVRVLLCKLRQRLPPGALWNQWGVGYGLDPAVGARFLRAADDAHVVLARSPRDKAAFEALRA